ncbi:hypothetical protein NLA06_02170 [Desulfomicrobium sp. ZS1]|uniref:hypothetical protein n=1 Tax=Desulfomicrobium sp. ZS1 TaxID=2952228 RepID=UPI0020B3E885|nr:hypothetical protein [Desulfomicrobium sp. ZS1]UTF50716.1 hypothetical protein NLA06_02170 [Desulfomicrobium sp. ZS1]
MLLPYESRVMKISNVIALVVIFLLFDTKLYALQKASLPYGTSYISDKKLQNCVRNWNMKTFNFLIGGGNDLNNNVQIKVSGYQKIIGTYTKSISDLKLYSESKNWNFEDMLIHMKIDYPCRKKWKNMDKYIVLMSKKDISSDVYDFKKKNILNTTFYIGHEDPFDRLNIVLSEGSSGYEGQWEYWDGSNWKILNVEDGTENLSTDGSISFIPPSNWSRLNIQEESIYKKWWIRFNLASSIKSPTVVQVKGDDWMNGDLCRGWDESNPQIHNVGTPVAYNPNPTSNSTARFRHQARATGYWSANYIYYHPQNTSLDGTPMAADYVASKAIEYLSEKENKINALMFDTANGQLKTGIRLSNPELFSDANGNWELFSEKRYEYVVNKIKEKFPKHWVGANPYPWRRSFIEKGDWALYEFHSYARQPSSPQNIVKSKNFKRNLLSYDDFLPENNTKNIKGVFLYNDTLDWASQGFFFDRGNRGPIACLAKHYIGMNNNTIFGYYSHGAFRYDVSDEVYYYLKETKLKKEIDVSSKGDSVLIQGEDFSELKSYPYFGMRIRIGDDIFMVKKIDNQTLQTNDLVRFRHNVGEKIRIIGVSHQSVDKTLAWDKVYKWSWFFPAMAVDIGQPDSSGHNSGKYDLSWKKGEMIGGGPEIWRRDYTKAIVLLRTAGYRTSSKYFTNYSNSIPLHGLYYPLYADGTLGQGISEISLRAGEGAILMKKNSTR